MDENGQHQPLLVLVGQTAVGKTALSLRLAKQLDGEIVSADSRLFYRGLDIGTAKPTPAERSAIRHHLIDVCNPDETVTLGHYQQQAYAIIEAIQARQKVPILVGGTGQYVKAVIEGWGIPRVPPQPTLRTTLAQLGQTELSRWLSQLDPVAAAKIDSRNVRRVIRALEVTLIEGRPISDIQRKTPPPYNTLIVGLKRDRTHLYTRIDQRVDQMMAAGLLAEVEDLRQMGYDRALPAMSGLGYRQLWQHLVGELSLTEAITRIKFETHRFARQQATWFRQDDANIHWIDMDKADAETAVVALVSAWQQSRKI